MQHRVTASISRAALQHNLAVARTHASQHILAVIKADAYGHGLVPVAETLQAADMFGVTDTSEALALRDAGCTHPILVMQGLISRDDSKLVAEQCFDICIHRAEDLSLLEAYFSHKAPREPLRLWLKLQSGMGRLGIDTADYPAIYRQLLSKSWVKEVVIMTHLANSSLPDSALNQQQLQCFNNTLGSLGDNKALTSIAASSGLLALDCPSDYARPGLLLYGSSPFSWQDEARKREHFNLHPVMTLKARLISISDHHQGDNIGYNSQFICPQDMRIGIVSIGYADGYPSTTPNGCPVAVRGIRTSTVGRVSMDMLAIDLSKVPAARVNDEVTLWGETISVDEVAHHTGVISYNLTSSLSKRVVREYV